MSLTDNIGNNTQYNFASGDIGDFIGELREEKQVFENEAEEEYFTDTGFSEPEKEGLSPQAANLSGRLVVTALDSSLSTVLGIIAKEDSEKFKADEEERTDLEKAISEYMQINGGDIPPGLMVFILILSIYGSKTYTAFQCRSLNVRKQKLEEKERELEMRERLFQINQKEKELSNNKTDHQADGQQ